MNVNEEISELLSAARGEAMSRVIEEYGHAWRQSVVDNALSAIGHYIKCIVLRQVDEGRWETWGVTRPEELWELRVTAKVNPGLVGPRILIHEDFSRTKLPLLQVL